MEKVHERNINDSYKSLNGKWPEKTQRVTNNPVIQKKVIIMPFLDESDNPMISLTNNKVIKWIEIKIDTTENDIWVNICSKLANTIYNEKNLNTRNRNKNGVHYRTYFLEDKMSCRYSDSNPFSNLLYSFSRMPPLGFEPRCLSTAS